MSNLNKDMIEINCFYYKFYIKKEELKNYNLTETDVVNITENIIKKNSGEQMKKFKNKIGDILEKFSIKNNNELDCFSRILTIYNKKNVKISDKSIFNNLITFNLKKHNIILY